MIRGRVFIIGAGPGDPGLITLKAISCLRVSDVVIYDHLVSDEILKYAGKGARLIYAGKQGGMHSKSQEEINGILASEARGGNTVARLKGGDPFVFGRGGEEVQVLSREGIPFEIIPGVTSATAVPAYAGIPLTHRSLTSSVAFVSGHEDPQKGESAIDWKGLSSVGTVVFLMGVRNLESIVKALIDGGKKPRTPAALIRWGTTARQVTVTGDLTNIVERVRARGLQPPAVFVVGEVVALSNELSWFESRPLFGRTIVVTRAEHQAEKLAGMLREAGAYVVKFPLIQVFPLENYERIDDAINELSGYDWIIFTSANGVEHFFDRVRAVEKDSRALCGVRVCAIGPSTARSMEREGIKADLVPEEYISEGVLSGFEEYDMKGKKVLLPRAAGARDVIPRGLERRGAVVDVVEAYRTVPSHIIRGEFEKIISRENIDMITLMSPSSAQSLARLSDGGVCLEDKVKIACIGPVTAEAAKDSGLMSAVTASSYTVEGLVEAIIRFYNR